jgi:hypothetical protein
MCAADLTKTERNKSRYLTGLCKDRPDQISLAVNVSGSYLEVTLFEHMMRYRVSRMTLFVVFLKFWSESRQNTFQLRNYIPISFGAT